MSRTLLQPYIPMNDGMIDIEAIDPFDVSDDVVLSMTFEELVERLLPLVIWKCPNRRVAHLVRYGRTERVRKKNLFRLWQIELPKLLEAIS